MTDTAVIFGMAGPSLSAAERAFFARVRPWGFILFARNCQSPAQVTALTSELRQLKGDGPVPVLIDQEGGRVARLRPPAWRLPPAAARFGARHPDDPDAAVEAAYLNSRIIAADLRSLGVTVNCTPCLDIPVPGAHDVIGDRAYGPDPASVAALGRAVCEGLSDGGVAPVIKHIPGHGRAGVDSHHALPVVDTPREELSRTDFVPFRSLADAGMAMTAHVVYAAIDPERPATFSRLVVADVIRGEIGFDGLLMTDDLSMRALSGSFAERVAASYAAGCDMILHCTGEMAEMEAVAAAARPLADRAADRAARAMRPFAGEAMPIERPVALARLAALMPGEQIA